MGDPHPPPHDHAGGLAHFRDSEILVCRTEFESARGFTGRVRGFLPNRWPEWFSPRLFELAPEPYGPFVGSYPLTEARGRHDRGDTRSHPGHVSIVLDDEGSWVFFAGDASYTQGSWSRARSTGCP